jgi:hypothetical protein
MVEGCRKPMRRGHRLLPKLTTTSLETQDDEPRTSNPTADNTAVLTPPASFSAKLELLTYL